MLNRFLATDRLMAKKSVNIISLGCSKNLIDSERLMKMFEDAGFSLYHNQPYDCNANITVINTCGFIGDAKEESVNTILEAVEAKESELTDKVIVMGCLSERYRKELPAEIEQVDAWYGKKDWINMVGDLSNEYPATASFDRVITTPRHYAYLKIAEGCDRFCSFCAIPLITGRYHSRSEEDIIEEVKALVSRGVKEFNVIAQDLSSYGKDIYGEFRIASLVDKIASVNGVEWIRLHYAYPSEFPMDLLDVMSSRPNVCKYLDIALQHVSDKVLSNMRRHITGEQTRELLWKIRKRVPGIHIRTTLMVGFPGEGEKEFEELLEFVNEQKFERMGAFAYCEEEDTYGAKNFKDDIPEKVKQERLDRLMAAQEEISMSHQLKKVGKLTRVIIDREDPDYYIGRTEFDSPEVDPEVLIEKSCRLNIGDFYTVEVTEALPFELIGKFPEIAI